MILEKGPWRAEVLPDFGCNLICLSLDGQELLRTPASLENLRHTPELYGVPLLFPPNRTRDGLFRFEGREYRLPINEPAAENHLHGFFTTTAFTVESQMPDSITTAYKNPTGGPESRFSFAFTLWIGYTRLDRKDKVLLK